jgi:enoyl-CoA hydratase
VDGPALGGGLDLATLCDIRFASPHASFGHPEIRFGAPPLFTPLRWLVGDGLARDLCMSGRRMDAEEALRSGLVSRIADDVPAEAVAAATEIAGLPGDALRIVKRYVTGNTGRGFDDSFRIEHDEVFETQIARMRPPEG